MLQVEHALASGLTTEDVVRREFERSFGVSQVECVAFPSLPDNKRSLLILCPCFMEQAMQSNVLCYRSSCSSLL